MVFAMLVQQATLVTTDQMKFKGWRIRWPQMQRRRSRRLYASKQFLRWFTLAVEVRFVR
jgi:hypothetical protein